MCKVVLNENLKGIELYFEGKPSEEVRKEMKENSFRWNGKKSCWYAKQSENTLLLGEKLGGLATMENIKSVEDNKINLYELTQYVREDKELIYDIKEIAKIIRSHVKKRFPFVKFSITTKGYNSINCDIVSSPFEENSKYLKAIQDYCKLFVDSYNYNNSDSMTDYFDVNFYGGYFQTSWKYEQIEASQEIIEAMKEYDEKLKEFEEEKRREEERAYQEYLVKREQEKKETEEYQNRVKENKEYIINNVEVIEIEEKNQYYIKNAQFAKLNKNNTLAQYQEEVKGGEYYNDDLKVTRELHFKDLKSYDLFSNMLLHDFDFIDGTGGSYTDDLRINSMTDYYNMTQEEKNSVKWLLSGIAVYLDNELMFVIDAQGYCYSRYVGLIGKDTEITKEYIYNQVIDIEELEERIKEAQEIEFVYNSVVHNNTFDNWYDTRKLIADNIRKNPLLVFDNTVIQQVKNEKTKCNLYRVLKEVDTIQDQFNSVKLTQGDKLTIVRGSMIGGASVSHIVFNDYTAEEYAQYKNNIKMTMKVKNKSGLYSINLHENDILIYKGWINIPVSVLYDDTSNSQFNGMATKYGSYDKQALESIIDHLQGENILPIINTYKPIFQ